MKSIKNLYIILFLFSVSFIFSSCSQQGQGILGKQVATTSDENYDIKNAPFAYDLAADTISYNSCVMMPKIPSTEIHGLKIGSSEGFVDNLGTGAVKGGLKLRTDFLNYISQKFTPDYPSTTITPAQVLRILNTDYSIFNANAKINFAVRKKTDYTVVPDLIQPAVPVAAIPIRDAFVFPQTLSTGYIGNSITKNIIYDSKGTVLAEGSRAYNLSDTSDPVSIEGSLAFNATEDDSFPATVTIPTEPFGRAELYSQAVRDAFNAGTQLLTVTFGGTDNATGVTADDTAAQTINNIKRPYKSGTTTPDTSKAYGRGYKLTFASQTSVVSWPKNRLTQINEINLESNTATGATSWSCEQFTIADKKHWNNNKSKNTNWVKDTTYYEPNCVPLLSADTICGGSDTVAQCTIKKDRTEKIKRIRRQYSVEGWNVGLMFVERLKTSSLPDRRNLDLCVSPKGAISCYLPTVGILSTAATVAADKLIDTGIQYDRAQDCYLTGTTTASTAARDLERKKGRCAQFASICIRSTSNY